MGPAEQAGQFWIPLLLGISDAVLIGIFGGIVGVYTRLVRLETKIDPLWKWWNSHRRQTDENST